jgi:hypothetical protein
MRQNKVSEQKNDQGLFYAHLAEGLEVPVLDITHPLFASSIDEAKLKNYLREAERKGEKRAESMKKWPSFLKTFFARHSYVMADLLSQDKKDSYLSGISTMMLKLGPGLIGGGRKMFLDRLASMGLGAITLRMRLRDIARCQADALIPRLRESRTNLCLVNIGGGTACDSLNTLILIRQDEPGLLENRDIEINVLDLDSFGAAFAERCVAALQSPGGPFNGLKISLRRIPFDWNEPAALESLLAERHGWLQLAASEGGLFEYGSDEVILRNLNALSDHSGPETPVIGSLMRDVATIDPGARAAMRVVTVKARMLGIDGLKDLLASTAWRLDRLIEGNPRYVIFALRKDRNAKRG